MLLLLTIMLIFCLMYLKSISFTLSRAHLAITRRALTKSFQNVGQPLIVVFVSVVDRLIQSSDGEDHDIVDVQLDGLVADAAVVCRFNDILVS